MTIEEILKSKGWSEQEVADIAPMLTNPRFRQTLEEQYGAIATERDQFKQRDEEWQRLKDSDWQPKVAAAEKEAQKARMELAAAREQIAIAKDYGYLTEEQAADATRRAEAKAAETANAFDPKKFVSMDDVPKLVTAQGDAIAIYYDIADEYGYLTGKNIRDVQFTNGNQVFRGMQALREEAKAKRASDLRAFVEDKFKFNDLRAAKDAVRQKENEDRIRADEREKARTEFAQQYSGNPNLRTAVASMNPFLPAKTSDGKMPHEIGSPAQLKNNRVKKFTEMILKSGAA